MRILLISLLFAVSLTLLSPCAEEPPLESLLSSREHGEYSSKVKYKDRIDIYRKAMSGCLPALWNHVEKRQIKEVLQFLGKLRALSRYAMNEPTRASASSKDLVSGQVKKFEIELRKLMNSLEDQKMAVPYDYRENYDKTIRNLEELRDQLLSQLFGS